MVEQRNFEKSKQSKTSSTRGTADTIVHSKRLTAHGKKPLTEEIREKALEAERQKRQRAEQERRKRMAQQQKKRELSMFLVVLVVVGAIFVADALLKQQPSQKKNQTQQETVASENLATLTTTPVETTAVETTNAAETTSAETEAAAGKVNPNVGNDLLAEFFSTGTGSKNRYNNLQVACGLLSGTVLDPGEQFSFNDTVGERTTERGFLEASVYTTAENNIEVGGGICQVASTLYECALAADLRIDERTAHLYTVEYVPYGLDATVSWGSLDFKFTNTTENPLEIWAGATDQGVTIRLYGTKTGTNYIKLASEIINTYAFETIKNVDYTKDVGYSEWETLPKNGYDVFSYQDIYDEDGELLERRFVTTSYYQKIDLVIRVGPYT